MKTRFSILFAILFSATSLFSQWQQSSGPEGGATYSLKRIDGVLWAGTRGGLYQSFDDGATWIRNADFSPEWSVTTIAVINGEIFLIVIHEEEYVQSSPMYLYRSTDGGNSWQGTDLSPNIFPDELIAIEIFQLSDKLFIWYEELNTLLRSDDNGQSWNYVAGPFTPPIFSALGYDENRLIASDFDQLYISTDFGDTWDPLAPHISQRDVLVEGDSIFLPTVFDELMVSTDLGQTWASYPMDFYANELRRGESGKLYAIGGRIYVSEDDGMTWDTLKNEHVSTIHDFIENGDGEYTIATYTGIFQTTEQGNNWQPTNTGIIAAYLFDLDASPWGEVFIQTNMGDFRSPNGGLNWFPWQTPFNIRPEASIAWIGETAFFSDNDKVYISTDKLVTFTDITPPNTSAGRYLFQNDGKIYMLYGTSKMFVTSDFGQTWESFTGPDNNPSDRYQHLEFVNNTMLLVDDDGEIYRSTDQGNSWIKVLDFWSPGVTYHRLYQTGNRVILVDGDAWFYSTDEGLTWNEFYPTGMPILEWNHDAPEPIHLLSLENLLFAVHSLEGVYLSADFGETWQPFNAGLGNFRVKNLVATGGAMFLGTEQGGIWTRGVSFEGASGLVYQDENGNGQRDQGEPPMPDILIEAQPVNAYAVSKVNGTYALYSEMLDDTIRAIPPSPYATVSPDFYVSNSTTTGNDFGIYFTPNINDLSIVATMIKPIRPGFGSLMVLTVKNIGTTELEPSISLVLPTGTEYLSATLPEVGVVDDSIFWELAELAPLAAKNIIVSLAGDVSLVLGDVLHFKAFVHPINNDEDASNNFYELYETVVGAYDPNDKLVTPDYLTPDQLAAGQRLTYTIRFQNTGTYYAENVRIVDTLSQHLNLSTLQILSASHEPMDWSVRNGRVLEFVFENIMLPDSTADEPGSHGFVKFSIQADKNLQLGDRVENTAHIFFDFNEAIVTNTATTPISNVNAVVEVKPAVHLKAWPNPSNGAFQLSLPDHVDGGGILEVFGLNGQLLRSVEVEVEKGELPPQEFMLSQGHYLLQLRVKEKSFQGQITIIR